MDLGKEIDLAISKLEQDLASHVQNRCSQMLTEVNDVLNKVLESTVFNFELLEFSLKQTIGDMKSNLMKNLLGGSLQTENYEPMLLNGSLEVSPEDKKECKPEELKKEIYLNVSTETDQVEANKYMNNKVKTVKHQAIHSCSHCSYFTPRRYRLNCHIISKHGHEKEASKFKVAKCGYCKWEGLAKWQLNGHMKRRHPDIATNQNFDLKQMHECKIENNLEKNVSEYGNIQEEVINSAIEELNDSIEASNNKEECRCNICGYTSNRKNYEKHIYAHAHKQNIPLETDATLEVPAIEIECTPNLASCYFPAVSPRNL